jgi:hypothetical protein
MVAGPLRKVAGRKSMRRHEKLISAVTFVIVMAL